MAESFLTSQVNLHPITARNLFVIYYGWLINNPEGTPNQAAKTIAAASPDLLLASFYTFEPKYINLSAQVRDLLHCKGTRIVAYVDTNYGHRDLEEIRSEASDYLSQDVDGIFFDQVYNFLDDQYQDFYESLYTFVKSHSKLVIINTGIAEPAESIMRVTDILMVEHSWKELYKNNSWFTKYPRERFMGNSSNEHPIVYPNYKINLDSAVRDTLEAWANGVGWHFSTDRYITLPDWFLEYTSTLGYRKA